MFACRLVFFLFSFSGRLSRFYVQQPSTHTHTQVTFFFTLKYYYGRPGIFYAKPDKFDTCTRKYKHTHVKIDGISFRLDSKIVTITPFYSLFYRMDQITIPRNILQSISIVYETNFFFCIFMYGDVVTRNFIIKHNTEFLLMGIFFFQFSDIIYLFEWIISIKLSRNLILLLGCDSWNVNHFRLTNIIYIS